MKKIVIATKNPGKLLEYKALLEPFGYEVYSLLDYGHLKEPKERGKTFLHNAMLKAKKIARKCHLPVIADDSGLEVRALGGKPGVRSKRFSKEQTDIANNLKLLKMMIRQSDRHARFVCQIVYYDPNSGYESFDGVVDGEIASDLIYGNGFGYDPLFIVSGLGIRMSELKIEEKNKISHRGLAFQKLKDKLERSDEIHSF
ncbi:MAG: RdgB/HAM1 family non-canonical purine NTP pyrophosphatase [Candidatus Izemoplasmatales bacterium]|jgi:XTP/dITP diphosphohydrolase